MRTTVASIFSKVIEIPIPNVLLRTGFAETITHTHNKHTQHTHNLNIQHTHTHTHNIQTQTHNTTTHTYVCVYISQTIRLYTKHAIYKYGGGNFPTCA